MHPAYRFVARHSLFILPGIGFVLAAWGLSRAQASWPAWLVLCAGIAVVWTIPLWLRHPSTAIPSAEGLAQRLRAGRISLLHFYSDF